jgi:hypothetical protein
VNKDKIITARYAGPAGKANLSLSQRPSLPVSPHLFPHHTQCKLFPSQNLLSQCALSHPPTALPRLNTYPPQLTGHPPICSLSWAPPNRVPSFASQGQLVLKTKPRQRLVVQKDLEMEQLEIQHNSPQRRPRVRPLPGYARTTRSPARLRTPARARRPSNPKLRKRRVEMTTLRLRSPAAPSRATATIMVIIGHST